MRRWSRTVPSGPGLFHGLGTLPERDGNVCYRYAIDRGDVDGVFASAAIVVEGDYTFPGVYQYAMETHSVIAQVDGDGITVWAACQHPFLVRAEIAALFDVPLGRVRIVVPYLGGGFGSKSYTKMEPITVALARKAGRPVKIVNQVAESMVTTRRHNAQLHMRTAAAARWHAPRARRAGLVRHRRLCRQRTPGDRHRRRCGTRSIPLVRGACRCRLRPHQHRAVGVVPSVRGLASPVGGRAAGG